MPTSNSKASRPNTADSMLGTFQDLPVALSLVRAECSIAARIDGSQSPFIAGRMEHRCSSLSGHPPLSLWRCIFDDQKFASISASLCSSWSHLSRMSLYRPVQWLLCRDPIGPCQALPSAWSSSILHMKRQSVLYCFFKPIHARRSRKGYCCKCQSDGIGCGKDSSRSKRL